MNHQDRSPSLPGNTRFGAFLAAVFALSALYAWRLGTSEWLIILLACSLLAALCAVVAPHILTPLNKGWYALGVALGRITGPIVLGALYFLVVTPFAWVTRRLGHDPLRLVPRGTSSYWIEREQTSVEPDSFRDQF